MSYQRTSAVLIDRDLRFTGKFFTVLLCAVFSLGWSGVGFARTTRSCNTEIFLYATQYQRDDGQWVPTVLGSGIKLNAGNLIFQASAPGVSHNLARMRASKKAEQCINHWWDRARCMAAQSTTYGDRHGRVGIRDLMEEAVCADLRTKRRPDLVGHRLRGQLYGAINGDRCCFDSNRTCPYNYGIMRMGRISTGDPAGRMLWPGVTYVVNCR